MKKYLLPIAFVTVAIASQLLVSCQKENNKPGNENELIFFVNLKESKSESLKKSSIIDAQKIILTIMKSDKSFTKYKDSEVKLYKFGTSLSSEKITLPSGSYELTFFALADSSNNILYAAPIGEYLSEYAYPLPIIFTVKETGTTEVNVNVISTEYRRPEEFGATSFNISAYFRLYIVVNSKQLNRSISAKLKINNGVYNEVKFIPINDEILIKDIPGNYTLTIERPGYNIYSGDFTYESLKSTTQEILQIELSCKELVTDNEGNVYTAVKIGNQTWLGENLRTGHFNNGDKIPTVIDSGQVIINPVSTWNVKSDDIKYTGRYYTYHAMIDSRGICPKGWHIPTVKEWNTLINYLGGDTIAGAKLKEKGGPFCWFRYNANNDQYNTNESGFSALSLGKYEDFTYNGEGGWSTCFWTADAIGSESAYGFGLSERDKSIELDTYSFRYNALNIRCIKD